MHFMSSHDTDEKLNFSVMLMDSLIFLILGCISYFFIALNIGSFISVTSVLYILLSLISRFVAAVLQNH